MFFIPGQSFKNSFKKPDLWTFGKPAQISKKNPPWVFSDSPQQNLRESLKISKGIVVLSSESLR